MRPRFIPESIDCHFAAQAVIGICNVWDGVIVHDPDLDTFDAVQKCTDHLLHGVSEEEESPATAVNVCSQNALQMRRTVASITNSY